MLLIFQLADYFPSCLTYVSSSFGGYVGPSTQPVVTDNMTNGFEINQLVASELVQANVTFMIANSCTEGLITNNAEITGGSSTDGVLLRMMRILHQMMIVQVHLIQ